LSSIKKAVGGRITTPKTTAENLVGMIKLNHLIKEHLIYEGLIHSVSMERFQELVERWAIVNDKVEIIPRKDNKITLQFTSNPTLKEIDNLLRFINTLGWYISAYFIVGDKMVWKKFVKDDFIQGYSDKTLAAFQAEAKFDLEMPYLEFDILYHISPSVNDEKIQTIGLVPKSLSKISYHPERVYFTRTQDEAKYVAEQFHKRDITVVQFSVYQIDIKAARRNNAQIRLFNDPNFENGIYTLSNIPPEYIKFLEKVTV